MIENEKGIIYKKMCDVMLDIDAVGKARTNQAQGFKFRGIDDMYNMIHSILAKHGIFCVPEVISRSVKEYPTQKGGVQIERILTMKYTFYAEDGSSVFAVVDGEARDTGDKTTSKCMSIAHKYCLLQTFCIPTEEKKDPDADTPEEIPSTPPFMTPERIKEIEKLFSETMWTKPYLAEQIRFFGHQKGHGLKDFDEDEFTKLKLLMQDTIQADLSMKGTQS